MIKEAIEKILDLARPEILTDSYDREYIRQGYSPMMGRFPDALDINNLTGIVDFEKAGVEEWGGRLIHVRDYNSVVLYQKMGGAFNERVTIITSTSRPCKFKFGNFMSMEQFIISLNADFLQNDDRDYLLNFVSGVRVDNNSKLEDDGISQTLKGKQGVSSLIKNIPVKNIVSLAPFRTFNEIQQPESKFIFRLKIDQYQNPTCGLFEADGEAWKQTVIQSIKAFFKKELPTIAVIA